jgi:hypothetical protein
MMKEELFVFIYSTVMYSETYWEYATLKPNEPITYIKATSYLDDTTIHRSLK